jgi:hypothetical protein
MVIFSQLPKGEVIPSRHFKDCSALVATFVGRVNKVWHIACSLKSSEIPTYWITVIWLFQYLSSPPQNRCTSVFLMRQFILHNHGVDSSKTLLKPHEHLEARFSSFKGEKQASKWAVRLLLTTYLMVLYTDIQNECDPWLQVMEATQSCGWPA